MKKLLALALALLAVGSHAQVGSSKSYLVTYRYNLNATTETFCSLPDKPPIPVPVRVVAATSTTVTGTGAFANIAVGDQISGTDSPAGGGEQWKAVVLARASANSITVDTALTLTSSTLYYSTLTCGTTANSGAFEISTSGRTTIQIDIDQLVLGTPGVSTIDSRILCRTDPSAQWMEVYPVLAPGTVTADFVHLSVIGPWGKEVNGTYAQCRVGLKIVAADDATDTGAAAEWVTISVRRSLNQQ